MSSSELLRLPTERDYYDMAAKMDATFEQAGGAFNYLGRYIAAERRSSISVRLFEKRLEQLALIIEPMDRSTFEALDSDFGTTHSIVQGGTAGLMLARRIHGRRVPVTVSLDPIKVDIPHGDDDDANKDAIARQLVEKGWEGLRLIGDEAKSFVEKWESNFSRARHSHMFQIGLGIVAMASFEMHQELVQTIDKNQFKKEIETVRPESYWDDILSQMLSQDRSTDDPSQ